MVKGAFFHDHFCIFLFVTVATFTFKFHSDLNKQLQANISQILPRNQNSQPFAIGGGFLNFNPI